MKKNKQVIDSLTEYFLNQDPRTVCRLLANHMIDAYRMFNLEKLPEKEVECFLFRMQKNEEYFQRYIESGSTGDLKLRNLGSS